MVQHANLGWAYLLLKKQVDTTQFVLFFFSKNIHNSAQVTTSWWVKYWIALWNLLLHKNE